MRYLISILTVLLFFIWILPLGVFIKPSQEKMTCGGKRAICMCSHAKVTQSQSKAIEGFGMKANSNNKESSAAGGSGHYFLTAHLPMLNELTMRALNDTMLLAYRNPFLRSIEHIPKV